jgi:cell division initiation protein
LEITPVDIKNLKFKRVYRGYNPQEVDDNLNLIVNEFENLIKENRRFSEKLENYESMENTLKETLLATQKTAEEMKKTAEEKAKVTIEKAKLEADKMINEAKKRVEEIQKNYTSLVTKREDFYVKFKGLLTSYLEIIEREIKSESQGKGNTESKGERDS